MTSRKGISVPAQTGAGLGRLPKPGLNTFPLLAGLVLMSCVQVTQAQGKQAAPAPAVIVTTVTQRELNAGDTHVARTSAVHRVELQARVKGVLQKRDFKEGALVDKNQLLFQIEPDQYQADQAVSKAAVAQARAGYEQARKYRDRLKSVARGGVSAADQDEAQNKLLAAKAKLDQARAQQQLSDLNLSYTQIHAPISGRISAASVDAGNLIGPQSGVLATIVQMDPIYVNFTVSERNATDFLQRRFKAGEDRPELSEFQLQLRLSNGSSYGRTGRLDYIASEIDRTTGTLAMRGIFDNPNGLLRPGQYVNVTLARAAPEKRLVIPQAAVQQDKKGYYVFVVNADDKAQQRRVELGQRLEIDWVVESGLEAGERVIFEGLQKVRPGAQVKPETGDPHAGLGE